MTVSITWSLTPSGSAISSGSHGNVSNGSVTSGTRIYIRHDGSSPIEDAGFYFTQKTGSYTGSATAAEDFNEMLEWGDGSTANDFGGIQLDLDAFSSLDSTWGLSHTQPTSLSGKQITVRTGVGDSISNLIPLLPDMSGSMDLTGVIPNGLPDVSFVIRLKVPTSETVIGTRQFNQVLSYSYTS